MRVVVICERLIVDLSWLDVLISHPLQRGACIGGALLPDPLAASQLFELLQFYFLGLPLQEDFFIVRHLEGRGLHGGAQVKGLGRGLAVRVGTALEFLGVR